MARGKTLDALLDDYRAECRLSLNPAHNVQVRETQIKMLQNTQEWLWSDYNWPHLLVAKQYPLAAGQRYYDFRADFDIERIEKIEVKTDQVWTRLHAGVQAHDYAAFDSDLDQRSWPPTRWRIVEDQVEFWPISDQDGDATTRNGYIQVHGIRRLRRFIQEDDRTDLDDRLIVLYAAARHLAAAGSKDAPLLLQQANKRLATVRGSLTKTKGFRMFGVGERSLPDRPAIRHYRPAGS